MFNKNLKYYRLKNNLSKKALASLCGVSSMLITYYENGERKPTMENMKKLAAALGVRVSDFLAVRNDNLAFSHGEFRKTTALNQSQQEFVQESVEEHFSRFYSVVEILGGDVLPNAPICHVLPITHDAEIDSAALRKHLNLSNEGPIDDLIGILENKGILVLSLDLDNDKFSGMNGLVDGRPYIVVNKNMTTERNRSTIVHELAHLMYIWPDDMDDSAIEKYATAISGAFLFPKTDVIRELGIRRRAITGDMLLVCKEYGISLQLLVVRAKLANVISEPVCKDFFIQINKYGWRKNEPTRITPEKPQLFEQLVYRAVNEQEISVQRGAELLRLPYHYVAEQCFFSEE